MIVKILCFIIFSVLFLCYLPYSKGSQHDLREHSPDYGTLGRKQRFVNKNDTFLLFIMKICLNIWLWIWRKLFWKILKCLCCKKVHVCKFIIILHEFLVQLLFLFIWWAHTLKRSSNEFDIWYPLKLANNCPKDHVLNWLLLANFRSYRHFIKRGSHKYGILKRQTGNKS